MLIKEEFCTNGWADLGIMFLIIIHRLLGLNTIENAWINMVLLLQTIGACTAVHPYSRLCGGLSGLLGSGGNGNLFSGIYGELDSGGGGLGSRDLTNTFLGAGEKGNFHSESRELSPHPQTR